MDKSLAFLGMGTMGAPMAVNLARCDFTLRIWNRTPNRQGVQLAASAGATVAASIAEAVTEAEIIFTCLGDVPDVEAVILGVGGVAELAPPNALVVDFSTIGPDAARAIGSALQSRGLRFLDAPISGGDIGAQNGTLTIMVGGDADDFAECQPLFAAIGKTIRHCGAVGSGQAVKMCNQVLGALHMVALCEAMQLARQQNLDPNLIVEVCGTGAAGSWALSNLGPKIIEADFAPGFAIKHMLKDLRLVGECARSSDLDLPGVQLADRLFKLVQAMEEGAGGEQGTQAMLRAYRESKSLT